MLSEKRWKLDAVMRLVMCLLVSVAFIAIISSLVQHFTGAKPDDNRPSLLLINSLAIHGPILVSVFVFLRFQHMTWSEAFGFKASPFWEALMWGIIVAVCFTFVGQGMNELCARALQWFHVEPQNEQAVETLRKATPGFNRVYMIFFSVVIAPVAEETLFRGVLYPTFRQYGFPRAALWGTSFLFAAIHLNLAAFLPLMLFAVVLAVLYEKTNNLLACIFAHSLFNAAGVILVYHFSTPVSPHS